jgi:hypothetical protein
LGLAIVGRLCDRYGLDLRIESGSDTTIVSMAIDPLEVARPAIATVDRRIA